MRFALSNLATPQCDAAVLAARAKALGYDGVELAHPWAGDPEATRAAFGAAGVQVACLATPISMPRSRRARAGTAGELRQAVSAAGRLGSPLVKILDTPVYPGQSAGGTAAEMGQWLLPLADYAAERGVTLVVENALHFRKAQDLWTLLESIGHPAVGAAWDLLAATRAGESPFVSVPTLNLRIQYARVRDAKLSPTGAAFCKVGEGDVPVESFVERLKGIGYRGYVTVGYDRAVSEELLTDAASKLRTWGKPSTSAKGDAKPMAKHVAPK